MPLELDVTTLIGALTGAGTVIGGAASWLIKQLLFRVDANQASFETSIKESQATYKQTMEKVCMTFEKEVAKCHEERAKINEALLMLVVKKDSK